MATCRECKLFDRENAKDKSGRIQKRWAVECFWKSKEQWPVSISVFTQRPKTSFVTADSGKGCKCFQKYEGD